MPEFLLCLHGWGGSSESFTELREALKGTLIEIVSPDLPGFGKEPEPASPWSVDDYAEWIENNEPIANCQLPIAILGHSHGGRIAIKIAARGNLQINHLYLCAAAGISRPRNALRLTAGMAAKAGNNLLSLPVLKNLKKPARSLLYKILRAHDYETASPMMRQTMAKVIQEEIRPLLGNISIPTDIFWGEDDKVTPVSDAHIIHDEIKGSSLHIYPGVKHKVHRDKAREIAEIIQN